MSALHELFANEDLVNNQGQPVPLSTLDNVERIGLYFSASWCPPCRMFTPALIDAYNEMKKKGKSFEVVLVSADRNEADAAEYLKKMPWLSVRFRGPAQRSISDRFTIQGIPTLVIIDKEGMEISDSGRDDIQLKGANAYDQWA
ncbi:hypothetical protein RCL1_005940 [Eukaryota sp. TZLM3-RCL]